MVERHKYMVRMFNVLGSPVNISASVIPLCIILFLIIRSGLRVELHVQLAFPFLVMLTLMFHEFGHVVAAKIFGIQVKSVQLNCLGGATEIDIYSVTPGKRLFVSSAGLLVNMLLVVLLYIFSYTDKYLVLDLFMMINLVFLVLNLLPIIPMDGGLILESVLSLFMRRYWAIRRTATVSMVLLAGYLVATVVFKLFNLVTIGEVLFFVVVIKSYEKQEINRVKLQSQGAAAD